MKIDLSTFNVGNMGNIPGEAVYFGNYKCNLYGYAIYVDEYGFIYISGSSCSTALGGSYTGTTPYELAWVVSLYFYL
jgi:hypothetical protein